MNKKARLDPLDIFPIIIAVQQNDLEARMKELNETQALYATMLDPNNATGKLIKATGEEYRNMIRPIVNRIAENRKTTANKVLEALYDVTDQKTGKTEVFPHWRVSGNLAHFFSDYKPAQNEVYTYYRIKAAFIQNLLEEGSKCV